jgi:hypothetical protein
MLKNIFDIFLKQGMTQGTAFAQISFYNIYIYKVIYIVHEFRFDL